MKKKITIMVRNIDKEIWQKFKKKAIDKNVSASQLLRIIIEKETKE